MGFVSNTFFEQQSIRTKRFIKPSIVYSQIFILGYDTNDVNVSGFVSNIYFWAEFYKNKEIWPSIVYSKILIVGG